MLAELARTSIIVLSTHQTDDVAALCERVIVLDRGRIRYDGQVTSSSAGPPGGYGSPMRPIRTPARHGALAPAATATSPTTLRAGVEHVEPSLEDAYLLLRGAGATPEPGDIREVLS